MNIISEIINIFSNRELALFTWVLIAIILLLLDNNDRKNLFNLLSALLAKRLIKLYFFAGIYLSVVIFALYIFNYWDFSYLKDSILWLFTVGIVLIFQASKAKGSNFFLNLFIDGVKLTAILEFVVNFYSFPYWVELILVIILILLVAIAYGNNEKVEVAGVAKKIISIISLVIIVYASYSLIIGYSQFITKNTLQAFLIPLIFTISFMPGLYVFVMRKH